MYNLSSKINQSIVNVLKDKSNKHFAIAMHNNPDGDAIGSAVAIERALFKLGKKVDLLIQNRISKKYAKIIGNHRVNKIFLPQQGKLYDVVILVDCSDPLRTIENINKIAKLVVVIDHHINAQPFGDLYFFENVSSTGMILYPIIKKICFIDKRIATALYLTISSDTNSFKNANTNYKTHIIASQLLKLGADINIVNDIYSSKPLNLIKLMGLCFQDIIYDKHYNIAYLVVTKDKIKKANASYEEASMLMDYIRVIENVNIAFLFLEGHKQVRVKARSNISNVGDIMLHFKGGGHSGAAGALIYCDNVYDAINSVLTYTKSCIDSERNKHCGNMGDNIKR